uniref:Regulatory protein zeste n=1 Tax=Meloidogyne javanica TaxID=6303 RepID=A0A915LQ40_MELJA
MATFIDEQIRDEHEIFFPSARTADFSRKSNDAWKELTSQLNATFGSSVLKNQVREKWHNLKRESKKKYAAEQKYLRGTGGGPGNLANTNDPVHSAIISCFGNSASFSGVPGGLETEIKGSAPKSSKIEEKKIFEFNVGPSKNEINLQELQRQVLEISLLNQQHISNSLKKIDKLVDRASSVFGIMEQYYRGKVEETKENQNPGDKYVMEKFVLDDFEDC